MTATDNAKVKAKSEWVSELCAFAVIAVAGAILAGWVLGIGMLVTAIPGEVTMKANTALGFVLCGVLLIVARRNKDALLRIALEALTFALGVLTLAQYVFDIDAGIDQLLAEAPYDAVLTTSPGRMAPTTAISFMLFSLAVAVDHLRGGFALIASRALAAVLFFVGLTSLLGYAYGAPVLYLGIDGITAMALPSAVLFVVLAVGIVWLRPDRGFPAMMAAHGAVGTHARSLLPMVAGAPLLVGAAVAAGYGRYYEGPFAIALTSLGSVLAAGIVAIVSIIVLRRSESALLIRDRALSAATNGVIITDHRRDDEPIVFVNDAFTRITGYAPDEAVGRNCRFLNQGVDNTGETMCALSECIAGAASGTFELRNRRKDGELFWNRLSLAPVDDFGGKVTHFVGIIEDFTDNRDQEVRLHRALEDAREANAMRDTFVRLVSHELRTPLNAALTWVRLMEVDRSDETREKGVAVVAQSIESQSRLIDDLVDVSRFASTGVRLEPERVNVRLLIEATIDELRPAIEASQRLSVTIGEGDYGATIDPLRVQQIVRNLLSNAIKYTPPDGRIDVELASSGET
ncbi:MAG: PAS domain-containing protein, partial [Woeseiaceae bacterium]|nr:PAS domain-containing protein [Woeseiaceae bacterium]